MNFLVFTCPTTGKDFSSHIHTDMQTVARVEKVPVTLHCSVCGKVHRMTVKNGHLESTNDGVAAKFSQPRLWGSHAYSCAR